MERQRETNLGTHNAVECDSVGEAGQVGLPRQVLQLVLQPAHDSTVKEIASFIWKKTEKRNVLFNDALKHILFYGYMASGRKNQKRNVLFNDALNTFYFTVIWHRGEKTRKEIAQV